jgi:hypothetical protein
MQYNVLNQVSRLFNALVAIVSNIAALYVRRVLGKARVTLAAGRGGYYRQTYKAECAEI